MKRLLNSSKFWVTVIGYIASLIAYKLFNDSTFALAVLGTFSAIVIGNTIEDSINQKKLLK